MKFRPVELNHPPETSTTRKSLLSFLTIGLQGVTRFVSNWLIGVFRPVAAGSLLPGALTQVSTATSAAFTLHNLWTSSVSPAASKFIARARGKGDDVEVAAVAAHLGRRVLQVGLLLAVAAPFVWHYVWRRLYGGPWWDGLLVSAILLAVAAAQFARGVHFGAGQVARGTRVDLITSVVGIGTTVVLLLAGVQGMLLTLPLSLTMGVYALLCWPWTARGRPERALRREMDLFVLFGALGSIASAGMLQISMVIASNLGAGNAYAPALQLVTPLSMIAQAMTLVLYPSMAQAQGAGDAERLRRQTDLTTRAFVAGLVPLFGAMAIVSRPLVELVWVGRYPGAEFVLPTFCVALLSTNLAAPSVSAVTSGEHRNMWYSLLLSQAGLIVAIITWVAVGGSLGAGGVALGYGLGAFTTAAGLFVVAWRLTSQRWGLLAGQVLLGLATIAALSWWRLTQPANTWLDIATAVAFGLGWLALSHRTVRAVIAARRS